MTWTLLVIYLYTPTFATQRFPNKESCENAGNWFKDKTLAIQFTCLQDVGTPFDTKAFEEYKRMTTHEK